MQIHKILPIMMGFQNHKHIPDKIFKMDPWIGAPNLTITWKKLLLHVILLVRHNSNNITLISPKKNTQIRIKFNPSIEGIHDTEWVKQPIRPIKYKYDARKLSIADKLNLPPNDFMTLYF